jgi:hypothetical protein
MRRRACFLTAAALAVGAVNLSAQTPNFAGTWTRIVDPSATAARGGGAGVPDALTISQDSKTLTMIDESMGSNAPKLVFNLDGTESKQARTDGNGNQSEMVSHAKWDGGPVQLLVVSRCVDDEILEIIRPRNLLEEHGGLFDVRLDFGPLFVVERSLGELQIA